jgi:hypothetical protein
MGKCRLDHSQVRAKSFRPRIGETLSVPRGPVTGFREGLARWATGKQIEFTFFEAGQAHKLDGVVVVNVARRRQLPEGPIPFECRACVLIKFHAEARAKAGSLQAKIHSAGTAKERKDRWRRAPCGSVRQARGGRKEALRRRIAHQSMVAFFDFADLFIHVVPIQSRVDALRRAAA